MVSGIYEVQAHYYSFHLSCWTYCGSSISHLSRSSQREPEQVFILLESIFATFDKIAKLRGVYKVETVRWYSFSLHLKVNTSQPQALRSSSYRLEIAIWLPRVFLTPSLNMLSSWQSLRWIAAKGFML